MLFNRTRQNNIHFFVDISLSSKEQNKSKLQKQRSNVLISIVTAAWYNKYIASLFLLLWFVLFFSLTKIYLSKICLLFCLVLLNSGARCSSWCDGSSDRSFIGWTHWVISHSKKCSTTGLTKGCGMYYPVWDDAYKRTLAANRKE